MYSDIEIANLAAGLDLPPDVAMQVAIAAILRQDELVAAANAEVLTLYRNSWAIFEQEFRAGRRSAKDAPIPPTRKTGSLTAPWPGIVDGADLICPMPALPVLTPATGQVVVGAYLATIGGKKVYQAGTPGNPDTCPDGFEAPGPNGSVLVRRAMPQFGYGGWWFEK